MHPALHIARKQSNDVTSAIRKGNDDDIRDGRGRFLGSHLCARPLSDGHDVVSVDNYFTSSRRYLSHILGDPRFEAMRHDACFPLYVEVDRIYNLACQASPVHYQHNPVQTTETSVHGAINMLALLNAWVPASCKPRPRRSAAIR